MKLVILDRDGVINHDSADYIKSAEEWQPIEGSLEAIAKLSRLGFTVVIATNQSGLARGLFDLDDLEAMHSKLTEMVETRGGNIAAIFYCPHGPDDNCSCRKPKTGLVDAIEVEFDVCAEGAPFVGDSLRDLQTGLAKGCQPILVRTGKGEQTLAKLAGEPLSGLENTPVFDDLAAAAAYIADHFG
ncbi:D-glycero-beta-D-manno-heptose 1,7-bisphosphate 7-phosphatase [Pseudoteredinibacter isoporae]|uniref:D-glycero-beta-D-manno-heptose 1,7-bisphosphate 7-phosphatase n=1 Tax=Pseudoteredinibacter isoporae TaxID=570281 RepID=UPI0031067284